jgi:transmembrane sensor
MSGQDPKTKDGLRDEAVAWLVRVQSDAATAEDWTALADWLEGSEARLAAFEEAELIVADLELRKAEIAGNLQPPAPNVVDFSRRPAPPARRGWIGGAIAAALAVLVGGGALWTSSQGRLTTYETRRGETRRIELADGSRLTLDGSSRLGVRLGWRTRRVEMGLAQASFDVAKDPSRPFVIAVGDQRVRVVGTEFNIRRDEASVRVAVRRGVVEVSQMDGLGQPTRLTVGQELRHDQGAAGARVRRVEPDAAFAWARGQLVADNETLGDIVADLNRRFPTPIRIAPDVAGRRFSGIIALDDEAAAVQALAAYAALTVDRIHGEIVLR